MYIVITSSPNTDGLTAACGKAAMDGIQSAGGDAQLYDISTEKLQSCRVCGDGWGACQKSSKCVIGDVFDELQNKIRDAEGIIIITPVYYAQPSERMKYFFDRFRRCEAFGRTDGSASGKNIHLIAAAGGSGNGTATCLAEMEQWCRHVSAIPQERIGITRFNRAFMLPAIKDAASRLVSGDYFKRI